MLKRALRVQILVSMTVGIMLMGQNSSFAQFSNEWINFSQTYYKIPVSKTGIYKLSYADLQAAGVPLAAIDPRRINLFHRGKEQAIFVQGQSDAIFDPADFIEFYGQRNDGTLDASLYSPSNLQPHPYYNLFSDTTSYFLSWNPLPVQGKRMTLTTDTNATGLVKENFHTAENLQLYTSNYSGGLTFGSEIQSTAFDQGEGWTGSVICSGASGCIDTQDFNFDNLTQIVNTGLSPQLDLLLVGREEGNHSTEIYVGASGGSMRLLTSVSYSSFETSRINMPLTLSDIGSDGKMIVRIKVVASGNRDVVSTSYIKVSFPQDFNINNASEKTFHVVPNSVNRSYVELLSAPANTRYWDISDADNVAIQTTTNISGGVGAIVLNTSDGETLYATNTTLSTSLKKVSFRSISSATPNYIIISNRSLMKPGLTYGNVVQAYAAYRASTAGGGYDTLTVSVDQLYNQFNYGETSPRAIYQFMKYLVNGGHPKFLFIIGKGLEASQGFYRKTSLLPTDYRDLVPSAGVPGSDMAFTAGLAGTSSEPAVPTGRLTASTPTQVAAYLNKVKETELLPFNDLWRKNLLHLSGGINAGEPDLFRSYVDGFKSIAENFYLGGKVETISKQSLNVELVNVKDQVNKGVDLITFFGHSGPGTIDIDIGFVSDPTLGYNNTGKYPGFIINGCNAGRFFDNRITFGEDWMLASNKGAKAFIAHSFYGFTSTLRQYTDIFYNVAYGDSTFMKKGIGEIQKETGRLFMAQSGVSLISTTQVQQMVLLGDPAVQLFGASKPDYEINSGSVAVVSLDGMPVTAQSNSYAVQINVRNFGRSQPGPLAVRLTRTLSDNSVIVYDSLFDPVLYSSILQFIVKKGRNPNEFGNNKFGVKIDPNGVIPELDETNNEVSFNYLIPLNGTRNIFPAPYSIVNTSPVKLVFQTTDLLADQRSFKIEIDTAATFDSPFLKRQTVAAKVLATVPLTLLSQDSLVYYWRTKLATPLTGESTDWTATSFTFIKNSPEGWAQIKFPQINEDDVVGLVKDPQIKRLKFLETTSSVSVKTFGSNNPAAFTDVSLKVNNEELNISTQGEPCRNNSLSLIAFDKSSTSAYIALPFVAFYDPRTCGRAPQLINNFVPSELVTGNGDDLYQWIANVNVSDSVVLFSIGDAGQTTWSSVAKDLLSGLGISTTQINGLQAGEPFVIFGKKGAAPGTARIFKSSVTPVNAQEVNVSKTITGRYSSGSLTSSIIGPAQKWSQLVPKITEGTTNDQYGVDVIGVDVNGNETVLKTQLKVTTSLSDVDPAQYPFLKLSLETTDDIDLTAVQLKKWVVTFTPMAEGMITYAGKKDLETVQEGQSWSALYGFTNISNRNFTDSLTVQVDVFSGDERVSQNKKFKIKPPLPGDTTKFNVAIQTKGKGGINDITVYVNPRILPEQVYDNNLLPLYGHLQVEPDKTGPLLDVTIDGRHIVNGDVVSPTPLIIGNVIDRNKFLLKTDTVGVNLFLQSPCASSNCPYKRISFSGKDVEWIPATASSDFQVKFHPAALSPGAYSLKMEATDASGNLSGELPYEVSFVVSDTQGFTLLNVYPNPSSDKFYFKFLIDGPTLPQTFQLSIYSATGSIVRNFGNEVLNILHVGTNEINMSATDAAGFNLPPGVYLFRMTTSMNGSVYTKSGRLIVMR